MSGREEKTLFKAVICDLFEKRPMGKPRRRWIDNIEGDARDLRLEATWIIIQLSGKTMSLISYHY